MDYVYVCTTGEKRFKIGYTKRTPEKRRKEHATGNPNDLNPVIEFQLDKARKLETFLKNRFYKYKCKTGSSTEHYEYNCTIDELRERIQEEKKLFDKRLLLEEQADQYEKCNSSNEMKKPSEEIKKLCSDLYQIEGQIVNLKYHQEELKSQIKIFIQDFMGVEGLVTWKTRLSKKFDSQKFKIENEELYNAYMIENKSRVFDLLAKG